MMPCQAADPRQAWEFAGTGRYPPPGSLTLRDATDNELACVTNPANDGGPVLLQTCRGDKVAEPSQRWFLNGSEIMGGARAGCLNIRENVKKVKGEELGDIHAVIPCDKKVEPKDNPAVHWRYDAASGHIISECAAPSAHCHRWAGQCITADAPPSPPPEVTDPLATSDNLNASPSAYDGSCSSQYHSYGDPACVLSSNETLICIFCGNR